MYLETQKAQALQHIFICLVSKLRLPIAFLSLFAADKRVQIVKTSRIPPAGLASKNALAVATIGFIDLSLGILTQQLMKLDLTTTVLVCRIYIMNALNNLGRKSVVKQFSNYPPNMSRWAVYVVKSNSFEFNLKLLVKQLPVWANVEINKIVNKALLLGS